MSPNIKHALAYGALIILNVMLVELVNQFNQGNIPIPAEYRWVAAVIAAGIVALTSLLPRLPVQDNK